MACDLMSRGWELMICILVACVSLGNGKLGVLLMLLLLCHEGEERNGANGFNFLK
jgi:hypothetical protein